MSHTNVYFVTFLRRIIRQNNMLCTSSAPMAFLLYGKNRQLEVTNLIPV